MVKRNDIFKTEDGAEISFQCWLPENEPEAILQISHGMAEYAERYDDFATYLCKQGFAVYANDHRGHGKTAGSEEACGYFSDSNGWIKVVTDMRQLTGIARSDYPEVPVFLLGHSMGSFLARTYITLFDDIHGVVLSGTGYNGPALVAAGRIMAFFAVLFNGKKKRSEFFDSMSFGSFNKPFAKEGPMSWLSRDKDNVKKYVNDPYCGFICTTGFFKDLFFGLKYINNHQHNIWIRETLPMLLLSGQNDPVGDFGKGVTKVYKVYKKRKIEDINLTLYPDARHEILNETNHDQVYQDIYEWLKKRI